MVFGKGGREEFLNKICKCHKSHPNMNLCRKFHPNRKKGKCLKTGGMVFWERGGEFEVGVEFREKNANVTNAIPKYINVGSLIQIGQWESVEK